MANALIQNEEDGVSYSVNKAKRWESMNIIEEEMETGNLTISRSKPSSRRLHSNNKKSYRIVFHANQTSSSSIPSTSASGSDLDTNEEQTTSKNKKKTKSKRENETKKRKETNEERMERQGYVMVQTRDGVKIKQKRKAGKKGVLPAKSEENLKERVEVEVLNEISKSKQKRKNDKRKSKKKECTLFDL